ncbi:MAG: glycine cleavage T C-terminal barrel domain-containing protein [Polyangiaceae bacterium]
METSSDALFRGKSMLLQSAPELGTIECSGGEVRTWLNGLVTCDLMPRKVGEGAFGLCVGKTGKVLAEVYIALVAEDRFLVGLRCAAVASVTEHFDRHLVMEDVALADLSADLAWSFVHGAPARSLAGVVTEAGGHLIPLDFTGTGTCAVIAPVAAEAKVKEALRAKAGDAMSWASPEEWSAFRVERGVPWFGAEFDESTYPQEAALERFGVSFQKGCYLGQEAVFMLQVRGHVKKRLVQIALDSGANVDAVKPGAPIERPDDGAIGAVTSVTTTPDGRTLALGHVKYKHAKPGEAFVIAGAHGTSTDVVPPPKES